MKRAIFIVLLLTSGAISFSQNLVVNPGFETWATTTKPTGWTTSQSCFREETNTKSGIYSCRHEGGISSSKPLGQTIPVTPEKKYTFSYTYKTEPGITGTGCRPWCYWKAGTISITGDVSEPLIRPSKSMKSDIWVQYSVEIISPANASAFILEVRTNQNSIAYFDDFVFAENIATGNHEEELPNLLIYPNPALDFLHISNIDALKHIDIQNFTGLTVWSSDFHMENNATIPISELKDGLYIINIKTSKKLICKKFIKRQL